MSRKIVVLYSDMHAGHNLGLCNPDAKVLDTAENPPRERGVTIGEWQRYLWNDVYLPGIAEVRKLAGKDEIILNHLGDLTQGDKHAEQLVVQNPGNQCRIAAANFDPWLALKNVKRVRFTSGTPAHDGAELGVPVVVSNIISVKHTVNTKVAHHSEQNIDGYCIDIAHHGAYPGSRSYLRGNSLRFDMRSFVLDCYKDGITPPNMLARGHYHSPVEETITELERNEMARYMYILCPSMTGLSSHARKVTKSISKITNGMCALEIVNGKLVDIHWYLKTIDTRVKETM